MFRKPINKFGFIAISIALLSFSGCGDIDETSGRGVGDQAPVAPTDLVAALTDISKVSLSWQDNSSAEEEFLIERRGGPGQVTFIEIADIDADSTTFEDWTIQRNYSYTYRIRASNEIGASDFSNEEDISIPNQLQNGEPEAPSNLVVSEASGTKGANALTWHDNSDNEDHFVILRREQESDPGYEVIATLGDDKEAYSDGTNESGVDYCYRVSAKNDEGSASSSEVCTGGVIGLPN